MQIYPASEAMQLGDHPSAGAMLSGDHELSMVRPDGTDLWVVFGTVDAGATITWVAEHGDEALYLVSGNLDVDGTPCAAGGGVVVEAGATSTVAIRERAHVVHVGGGAAEHDSASRTLVIGPGGAWSQVNENQNTRFIADATSRSCSLWLLYSERFARHDSPTHSHAQDELIHVLRGELVMGAKRVRPGDTLFVEGDRRYRFHSGDDGYAFVNYRSGPSVMTIGRDDPPIVENGTSTGMVHVDDVFVV